MRHVPFSCSGVQGTSELRRAPCGRAQFPPDLSWAVSWVHAVGTGLLVRVRSRAPATAGGRLQGPGAPCVVGTRAVGEDGVCCVTQGGCPRGLAVIGEAGRHPCSACM